MTTTQKIEVPPHDEARDKQQHGIEEEDHRTDLDIDADLLEGMAQHQRKTCRSAARTLDGHDTADPTERIQHHAQRHQEVLLDGFQDGLEGKRFHKTHRV